MRMCNVFLHCLYPMRTNASVLVLCNFAVVFCIVNFEGLGSGLKTRF